MELIFNGRKYYAKWVVGDYQYHVWFAQYSYDFDNVLYKNSTTNNRYKTRKLDVRAKCNKQFLDDILSLSDDDFINARNTYDVQQTERKAEKLEEELKQLCDQAQSLGYRLVKVDEDGV